MRYPDCPGGWDDFYRRDARSGGADENLEAREGAQPFGDLNSWPKAWRWKSQSHYRRVWKPNSRLASAGSCAHFRWLSIWPVEAKCVSKRCFLIKAGFSPQNSQVRSRATS